MLFLTILSLIVNNVELDVIFLELVLEFLIYFSYVTRATRHWHLKQTFVGHVVADGRGQTRKIR